jgi:hypothetical protein
MPVLEIAESVSEALRLEGFPPSSRNDNAL